MASSNNEDDDPAARNNNKLLMDAMMAQMMSAMRREFETMRTDVERLVAERPRRSPLVSEAEAYYNSSSSRSNGSRRRRHHREERPHRAHDPLNNLKIKIPEFKGSSDPEEYLEWEKKIELVFDCKEYTSEQKVKLAPTEFKEYALRWWDNLVATRRRIREEPITTWSQMKILMRKRFIPSHYFRELHFKLRTLAQGDRSVEEYYKELETLLFRADIEEDMEATMARFMGGLNRDILDKLEVTHYMDIEELLHKAILFEKQLKRRSYKPSQGSSSKSNYHKEAESGLFKDLKVPSKPKEEEQNSKEKEKTTNSKTRDIKCYKCQGSGHYARECPNRRIMVIKESGELESEDEKPEKETEEEQIIMPAKGELLVTRRTLNLKAKVGSNEQRENLFHTRCVIQGKVCSMVIDGGSCTNVASETLVEKLGLTIQKRPTVYKLNWLNEEGEMEVNDQVLVPFSIGQYEDEVLCDVLPMDAGHILLGRPWQSDRRVMHDGYTNRYSFDFKDQKIVLVPLTPQEVYQDQLSLKKSKTQSSAKAKTSTSLLLENSKGSSSTLLPIISKYCCMSLTMSKQVLPSNLKLSLQETQDAIPQRHLLNLPPIEQTKQKEDGKETLHAMKEEPIHSIILSHPELLKTFDITYGFPSIGMSFVLLQGNKPIAYLTERLCGTTLYHSACKKKTYVSGKDPPTMHHLWSKGVISHLDHESIQQPGLSQYPTRRIEFIQSFPWAPNEKNFQLKPRSDEQLKLGDNAYPWNLPGKFKLTPSFSVSKALSFLAGQADLRTNLFQERGDDVIMIGPDIEVAHEVTHQVAQEEESQDGSVKQHEPGWNGAKEQLAAEEDEHEEPGTVDYTFLPPNKGTLKCVNPTTMVVIQTT